MAIGGSRNGFGSEKVIVDVVSSIGWRRSGQAGTHSLTHSLTSAFPSIADQQRHAGQHGEHSDRQHPRDGVLKGHVLIDCEAMKRKDDR